MLIVWCCCAQTFNRHNPAGPYKLALNDPTNRQIAVELYRLREQQGDKSWSEVSAGSDFVILLALTFKIGCISTTDFDLSRCFTVLVRPGANNPTHHRQSARVLQGNIIAVSDLQLSHIATTHNFRVI
jgi:hypothetical protein